LSRTQGRTGEPRWPRAAVRATGANGRHGARESAFSVIATRTARDTSGVSRLKEDDLAGVYPAGGVAPRSNTPDIFGRRVLTSGRRARRSGLFLAETRH